MNEDKELVIKRLLQKELMLKEQYDKKEQEYNNTCSNIINLELEVDKLQSNLNNRYKKIENNYFIKISIGVIISLLVTLKLLITVSNVMWLLSTIIVYILSISGIRTISKRLVSSNLIKDKEIIDIRRELIEKRNKLNKERDMSTVLSNEKYKLYDAYMFTREMKHDEMFKGQQRDRVNNISYVKKLKK